MRYLAFLALLCAPIVGGCGEDSTTGSGGDADGDAGGHGDGHGDGDGDGDGDAPAWMPRDSGVRGGDASVTDYSDRSCTLLLSIRDPDKLPVCTADTRACIDACAPEDGDCPDLCLAADPTPENEGLDCSGCAFVGLFQCFADEGCAVETNAFLCCFEDKCLGGGDNCADTECADELTAVFECAVPSAPGCLDFVGPHNAACFADADADAGI